MRILTVLANGAEGVDGDGKLSPEELQAIPPHHGQPGPHHAAPGGPKGPGAPKMDGPRRPGGPRAEGPRAPRGPEGRRGGEGRRGDGDRGPRGNRPDGPRPQLDPNRAPIMAAGWILIEEKYDADKDGKLNEAEMAQLNADASKALEARRSVHHLNNICFDGQLRLQPPAFQVS